MKVDYSLTRRLGKYLSVIKSQGIIIEYIYECQLLGNVQSNVTSCQLHVSNSQLMTFAHLLHNAQNLLTVSKE